MLPEDPNLPPDSPPWWKLAVVGPWLHGFVVWLATDGYSITEYVYKRLVLSEDGAPFNLHLFLVGLAATAFAVILSAGRNRGAVLVPDRELRALRAVPFRRRGYAPRDH